MIYDEKKGSKIDNIGFILKIILKYKYLIIIVASILGGFMFYKAQTVPTTSIINTEINFTQNNDEFKKIYGNISLGSQMILKKVINNSSFREKYEMNKGTLPKEQILKSWLKSSIELKKDEEKPFTIKVITNSKEFSQYISKLYLEELNIYLKSKYNKYYQNQINYYDQKIQLIKNQVGKIEESKSDLNSLKTYNEAIDKLCEAKLNLNKYSNVEILNSEEQIVNISQKKKLIYPFIGIGAGIFGAIFIAVFIEYFKSIDWKELLK